MEKFNLEKHWKDFKEGAITVNCKTEELAKEFLEYCEQQGLRWGVNKENNKNEIDTKFEEYMKNTCYRNSTTYDEILYKRKTKLEEETVEFTGFIQQIDHNKSYTLQEIFEINNQFKDNNLKFINEKDISNKDAASYYIVFNVLYDSYDNEPTLITSTILNMKFQVLNEIKYISFQEAFNEFWNNKKRIHCEESNYFYNVYRKNYILVNSVPSQRGHGTWSAVYCYIARIIRSGKKVRRLQLKLE